MIETTGQKLTPPGRFINQALDKIQKQAKPKMARFGRDIHTYVLIKHFLIQTHV